MKQHPIPFDERLSAQLDRALIESESSKSVRRWIGKRKKSKIERKIWGSK